MIEKALRDAIPPETAFPPRLHEAIHYSIFGGGKRLRPILVLAAAEAVGGVEPKASNKIEPKVSHQVAPEAGNQDEAAERALPAAAAIELLHTYSLVHDDLPCMDNDDFRRGRLTTHRAYGEVTAILVGDALQAMAFSLLSDPDRFRSVPCDRRLRVVREVAEAAGPSGLVGGQFLDTLDAGAPSPKRLRGPRTPAPLAQKAKSATRRSICGGALACDDSGERSLYQVRETHVRKTGALIRAAVRVGAILGGAAPAQLAGLTEYAEQIGLAFQITDDILDVQGDPVEMGKAAGKDRANRRPTYPGLLGLSRARAAAEQSKQAAIDALASFESSAEPLRALAGFIIHRRR